MFYIRFPFHILSENAPVLSTLFQITLSHDFLQLQLFISNGTFHICLSSSAQLNVSIMTTPASFTAPIKINKPRRHTQHSEISMWNKTPPRLASGAISIMHLLP